MERVSEWPVGERGGIVSKKREREGKEKLEMKTVQEQERKGGYNVREKEDA